MDLNPFTQPILVAGSGRLAASLGVCLLQAGHEVYFLDETGEDSSLIDQHLSDLQEFTGQTVSSRGLTLIHHPEEAGNHDLAIVLTKEDVPEKVRMLEQLERYLPQEALIAINMESISLDALQRHALYPGRIIGANWTEPVHTTCFLEIISNQHTQEPLAARFYQAALAYWGKDPYLLKGGRGIRTRMMCALIREALYLVEHDYVTVEDIDRACRNDPGYYLPFAGNFRYMDMMGGYMYGVVMQDLNPELSTGTHIPAFCEPLLKEGAGMTAGRGFYTYQPGEAEQWETAFRRFSYRIRQLMDRYPFKYLEQETAVNT